MKRKDASVSVPARKLRKSCSLPSCTSPCGTCMHCTCDGRCGHHAAGHCGGRREGSGRGCKRPDCTRDDRCLHSNRATCCHCRNLVSSAGRAAKRPRELSCLPGPLLPVYRPQVAGATGLQPPFSAIGSNDALEAELCAFLHDANFGGDLSLCEYDEWAARRQHCNLVVVVSGMHFNLHKHPMLLESCKLHHMARQVADREADESHIGTVVPTLELPLFPGGAEMFETLAIYCYTGEIFFTVSNVAVMNCAIEFLDMRDEIRQSVQRFLTRMSRETDGLKDLVQVLAAAETLTQTQPELFHSANQSIIEMCMHALVERKDFLNADAMPQLLTLSRDLFSDLTHRILTSTSSVPPQRHSTVEIARKLCVHAELAHFHQDAQGSSPCNRFLAQQCVQLFRNAWDHAVDALETERMETTGEKPLELTLSVSSDMADKMLTKFIDDHLGASGGPRPDASIGVTSDSFYFNAYTLPETFVV